MTDKNDDAVGAGSSSDAFADSLRQRQQAAQGLEKDLLSEVPLLYGSPGKLEAGGDPGIILAELHRDEMLRRNGGGVPPSSRRRGDAALPFEGAIGAILILFLLFFVFAGHD